METAARAAHRETLAELSGKEQKQLIAMMQRIVAENSAEAEVPAQHSLKKDRA
jgi:MarR family transcriptional regulator, lower aerobic nicotinate degradation pathway regulator